MTSEAQRPKRAAWDDEGARRTAEAFVAELARAAGGDGAEFRIVECIDLVEGWVFFCAAADAVAVSFADALAGAGPIFVDRRMKAHALGSALPWREALSEFWESEPSFGKAVDVFAGNPWIRVVRREPTLRPPPPEGLVASGQAWELVADGSTFRLGYISGALAGGGEELVVSAQEAEEIRTLGDEAVDRILRRHNAG